MDAEIPVIDGLEATRRIRAYKAATGSRPPIACVTPNRGEALRTPCLVVRMDAPTRNWIPLPAVTLNPERDAVINAASGSKSIEKKAA